MKQRRFTLMELLIVIAIIGILMSLLLPSLNKAKKKSQQIVCLGNTKQIGAGLILYTTDYNGSFPTHSSWSNLGGKRGASNSYSSSSFGFEDRPLNVYVNAKESYRCPSDKGDPYGSGEDSAYDAYGTSYLDPWQNNFFATAYITHTTKSKKITTLTSTSNKLLISDWVWHGNRALSDSRVQWHNNDARTYNTVFADGHAEYFDFGLEIEGWYSKAPEDDALWW